MTGSPICGSFDCHDVLYLCCNWNASKINTIHTIFIYLLTTNVTKVEFSLVVYTLLNVRLGTDHFLWAGKGGGGGIWKKILQANSLEKISRNCENPTEGFWWVTSHYTSSLPDFARTTRLGWHSLDLGTGCIIFRVWYRMHVFCWFFGFLILSVISSTFILFCCRCLVVSPSTPTRKSPEITTFRHSPSLLWFFSGNESGNKLTFIWSTDLSLTVTHSLGSTIDQFSIKLVLHYYALWLATKSLLTNQK